MNSGWAASAGEAVDSDCGESAGHVGAFLANLHAIIGKKSAPNNW
jgi:hypothetical protein